MILALDISLSEFGLAVFDSEGRLVHGECIITKPVKKKLNTRVIDSDHLRIKEISLRLKALYEEYCFKGIVAEVPPGGTQGARSATALGLAKGTVWAFAALMDLPFEGYLPYEAKKAATGKMNASKEEVAAALKRRWRDFQFPQSKNHLEAVCDACSAYIAAERNNLVLTLKGIDK
jgi:Holliday junction resolvasome RuvABC endonuclease subunit